MRLIITYSCCFYCTLLHFCLYISYIFYIDHFTTIELYLFVFVYPAL